MLIPLAFGGSAGSLLALTGSPVNVVVSQASAEAGAGSFGFLEFGIVGLPLVLVTIALAVWVGPLLLPARSAGSATRDLSRHARTLATHYELWDGFTDCGCGRARRWSARPPQGCTSTATPASGSSVRSTAAVSGSPPVIGSPWTTSSW
jgi:hypothetical protein